MSIAVTQLLSSGVGSWWMVVVTCRKMLKKWADFTVPPPYVLEYIYSATAVCRYVCM